MNYELGENKLKIFCVIPAYNEDKTIVEVIDGIKPFVGEAVVVDDCSTDRTCELVENNGRAVLLRHIINRGQGAALRTGTEYALRKGADIIVHFDADGQFLPRDIKTMIAPIKNGEADIVFGSRFLGGESEMPFFKKRVIMPLARMANGIFLNVKMTDPQNGFRAFSRGAAEKIDWKQDRMSHCSEILSEAANSGLKIKEAPITVIYRGFGQKFSGGIKILKELFIGALIK